MIVINNLYNIGDIVYIKTDDEQLPRIVLCLKIYKEGEIVYELGKSTEISSHYEFELSKEKVILN